MTKSPLPFDPIERAAENWQRTWGDATHMRLATSIMRVQQLLINAYDEALRPHGLTFARFEALALLRFSRNGALPMKVIGDRLQVHPTSVTNIVERLSAADLVQRQRNPKDGRGVLAVLTDRGREVVEAAAADLMAMDFGLAALEDGQITSVVTALSTLRRSAGDFEVEQ
ncbi:MarR family winged helix-turn-helix transcriptional regulator [Blastococcus sp. Marseille-P5729]|uniref:MarR family winged helix-turn-helix transcriptional regulator n=1 Tax=Blastococcus sp. Marseille-P5729 TaxID=2086582 RepID=UPI001F28B0E2|nr:MarR family transcriptional regulator [Blastococcus sp. Marseille-P5729]